MEEYIGEMTDEDRKELLSNYETLRDKGEIGDCKLRMLTDEFIRINDINRSSTLIMMSALATEAYRYYYNKSKGEDN